MNGWVTVVKQKFELIGLLGERPLSSTDGKIMDGDAFQTLHTAACH